MVVVEVVHRSSLMWWTTRLSSSAVAVVAAAAAAAMTMTNLMVVDYSTFWLIRNYLFLLCIKKIFCPIYNGPSKLSNQHDRFLDGGRRSSS